VIHHGGVLRSNLLFPGLLQGAPSDGNSTNVPALAVLGDCDQPPAKQHCPGQTEQEDTEGGTLAEELRWRRLAPQQLYDGFLSTLYKGNFGLVRMQPPVGPLPPFL